LTPLAHDAVPVECGDLSPQSIGGGAESRAEMRTKSRSGSVAGGDATEEAVDGGLWTDDA
jgi:hypothetical protein